ncbi:MAG: glycosyltransferase [Candidatus Altiarchaeales archaeon]|nr:glycosyltransferase [Candidatus Altiarchaeales archaeon]
MEEYAVSEVRPVYSNQDRVYPFELPSVFRFYIPLQEDCKLEYIDFFLGTYGAKLNGLLTADILHGDTHSTFNVDLSKIVDNAPLRLTLETHPVATENITVTLKIEEKSGRSVALWMNKSGPSATVVGSVDKTYTFKGTPLISIITPVYKPFLEHFQQTAESIRAQHYKHWQWCIHDDGSNDEELSKYLFELEKDERIKVTQTTKNKGISAACNTCLAHANGAFFTVVDHDDIIQAEALLEVAHVINEHPDVKIIYTDEDKVDKNGNYGSAFFKPDISRWMLLSQNYTCHMTVYSRDFLGSVGGFRSEYDGAQDYDYMLRCVRETSTKEITHIPHVLYHWRMHSGSMSGNMAAKPEAHLSGLNAVRDAVSKQGHEVLSGPYPGTYNVYLAHKTPSVTIVIPTKDNITYLDACLSSILASNYEGKINIIIVDNQSEKKETLKYLSRGTLKYGEMLDGCIKILRYDRPFNFSAINNFAAESVQNSDYLLFLNDDIEVLSREWLDEMMSFIQQPGVGVVGAKLLYPDRRIQHAGVIIGIGGVAGHSHKYIPNGHPGYFARPHIVQNVSAVTGACMLVSRSVFEKVGGFEEKLPKAFNDVDFCLKVREAGYEIIYNPRAVLIHHESISRGKGNGSDPDFADSVHYMLDKWECSSYDDPYYNPNLSLGREDFSFRY